MIKWLKWIFISSLLIFFSYLLINADYSNLYNNSSDNTQKNLLINSDDLNEKENSSGKIIKYYNEKKFTGWEVLSKDRLNNDELVYTVKEFKDGLVLHEGKIKYIDKNGSEKEKVTNSSTSPGINIDEIITNGMPDNIPKLTEGVAYETENYSIMEGVIKPGQAISHILTKYNLNSSDIYNLEKASEDIFDLKTIRPGKSYSIICSKDSNTIAKCFVYEKSHTEYVVFDLRDQIKVYKGEKPILIKTKVIRGIIGENGSLWTSLTKQLGQNQSAGLIMTLANKIYAWTIDFDRSIQPTDSFVVYYEEKYVGNECVGIGKVMASSFTYRGEIINAFRFEDHEGHVDYFDEKGNNLRKAFLRSPIAFNFRISSNFGKRKHPISGKWKNHNGTDYAAKTGTNILATADGIIEFAGENNKKRGNGIYVKIAHNGPYKTLYLHMNKHFVKSGQYVNQGEVIGEVGSTGYATGPHLHYELWVKDGDDYIQVDPFKHKLPPSLPIKEANKGSFEKIRDEFMIKLNQS